jgi:hypothetical protein
MFWAPFLFVTDVELPTVLKKSMQTFIQIVMKRNDCINKVTVSPVLPVSLDRIFMKSKGSWMTQQLRLPYMLNDGYIGSCLLYRTISIPHLLLYSFWAIMTLEYHNIFPINLPIILETLNIHVEENGRYIH